MTQFEFKPHNHESCVAGCVDAVENLCKEKGLQFTPIRRRVLEILLREHRAVGAYHILDQLRAEGHKAQPPVAYRALDFLVSHGFAHKIEQLNAFMACETPGDCNAPAILICKDCQSVAELPTGASVLQRLAKFAEGTGFVSEQTTIEVKGVCPDCVKDVTAC